MTVLEQVIEAMDAADSEDVKESEFMQRLRAGEDLHTLAAELGEASSGRWCEAFSLDTAEVERVSEIQGSKIALQGLFAYGARVNLPMRVLIEGMCGGGVLVGIRIGLMVADALAKEPTPDA